MSSDISHVLARWPYEDRGLQVRRITGDDGRLCLQLRIDLGLMQMDAEGRPDGQRPHGFSTLLDYHRHRAEEHRRQHGWYEGFELSDRECEELRRESLQYYHRRISWMVLQEYDAACADADHNLEVLDLLKAFARDRDDWLASEQYRAFILSHRIRCCVLRHLRQDETRAALLELEAGVRRLRAVFAEQNRLDEFEESSELASLDELRRKLDARSGVTHRQRLEVLLDEAMRREEPDEVAELRAQLRRLEE